MQTAITTFTNIFPKPEKLAVEKTDDLPDIHSISTPSSIEDDQDHEPNDLSLEFKSREVVYVPRDWVAKKLQQIKTTSSLSVNTIVRPSTVQMTKNVLSMDIQTENTTNATFEFHFFQNGIIKLNCVNPVNPSKFSFEMIEKPANLVPYDLAGSFKIEETQIVINISEAKMKVVVAFTPFSVTLFSTKNTNSEEILFEMNKNNSLKFDSNITADFSFSTEYLYGLPERACNLLLEDTKSSLPYRFYNQDTPAYPIGSRNSLYATVPIMIARRKDSSTLTSLYWQNTSDTYVDIHRTGTSSQAYWLSERGNLECYIFVSHSNKDHYKAMSDVFGNSAMPQYFSLGYHQSRWSYNDQQDVLEVNEKFNEHEIPYDSITLDIDHTDGCRYFTWNEELFPDPVAMQNQLVQDGRQLITIADPHIKVDDNYYIYREAIRRGLVVKDETNETFVGKCWPGESIYLDFLNEETRNYWASQYSYEKYDKSTPNVWAWNDMNEPSVFEMPGNHMPLENLQTFKTISEPEKAFQVEHREVHNIYGYLQSKATYDGLLRRNKDQNIRPHVLTRSFYAGSQKWATIWTGDTASTWEYLKITVPQMLSLSLCGISNVGGDVGGFIGDPEPELAVRWYQLGAFMPYFRGHSSKDSNRREPWLYEKKYFDLIKESIKMRYRLLPYWYTCFANHSRTAIPILRPVWFEQEKVLEEGNMHDQERFMVGDGLLVVPIMEKDKSSIMAPLKGLEGRWYDYFNKKEVFQEDEEIKTGLERIGCFVKGGNIIPTFEIKSDVKSTKDAKESSISLYVALDENDSAKGEVYFDDGETFDYKDGRYARKRINFEENTLSWEGEDKDTFSVENQITKVFIMGVKNNAFKNAYLEEDGKVIQKVNLVKEVDSVKLEFKAVANKSWKIILE